MLRLESFGRVKGLVVCPWGDCSKDMHSLIKVLGETKLAAKARARGRQASDNSLSVTGQRGSFWLYFWCFDWSEFT